MTARPFSLEEARKIVTVPETAITADGTAVVFTQRRTVEDRTETSLWLVTEDCAPRPLTQGPTDRAPRMTSQDDVLFLRDIDGAPQLHLLPQTGEAVQLTRLPLGVGAGAMSPDGTQLAFAAHVDRGQEGNAAPIVVDTLDQKADGAGWIGRIRRHLFVLDLESACTRQITDGEWDASDPVWSPDGTRLAFTAAMEARSDVDLECRVYAVDVDDPMAPAVCFGHATGITGPAMWAPDGESIIAVGSPTMTVGHARLLRLFRDGRDDTDLSGGLDRNVMPGATGYPGGRPALTSEGEDIIFCLRDRGWTHLYGADLDGGGQRPIVAEPHCVISGLSVASRAPRAAVVVTTPQSFAEVALVDLPSGKRRVLTSLMDQSLPGVELHRPEPRQFEISDGTTIHGWLLGGAATTGPAPLLLDIHGGPHNAWAGVADEIHLYQQLLAARGWRVLTLNSRGSDGYGEEFLRALDGEWGRADLADFLEPLDQLVTEGLVDADKIAVTGYSYGGLATCALTSHTDRFAAAVAGGLLCEFVSIAAQRLLPEGFFAKATAGAAPTDIVRLAEMSPITNVERVTTPTLVLHGENDETCPVGQAQEWFSALRVQGVPSRLVVYPGCDHLFIADGPIEHRLDYHARLVEWVEQYTRAAPRPAASSPAPRGEGYWRYRLDLLRERYGVAGAQFGIVQLDNEGSVFDRVIVSSGVLNTSTQEPVTDDAIFQIGSITKVWTTMLIMQLVDEGLLDLDVPVRTILQDFRLAGDPAPSVTVRELLDHTSGIDGDAFIDTGRGDDCVERYVEKLQSVGYIHTPGARFSYCNAGFVVAGRIVEILRGMSWDDALQKYLIEPMGLEHTITRSEDAPRFAVATGHSGFGETCSPVPAWSIVRSMGPAGLITSSIGDLLTFAKTALRGGAVRDTARVLSAESARLMTTEQIDLRESSFTASGWGLGWFLEDWHGTTVYGHNGGTIGQRAYLRLFPGTNYAIALLTSGGQPDGLYAEIFAEAASSIDGSILPEQLRPDRSLPPEPLEGIWENAGNRVEVKPGDKGLELTMTDRLDLLRDGKEDVMTTQLHASTAAGVYAYTASNLAGWEQLRMVPGGVYLGSRFMVEVPA